VDALAEGLDKSLNDDAWRLEAIWRGIARAQQFTWHKAAQEMLSVYERVLGRD
jgi:hypothetical protein